MRLRISLLVLALSLVIGSEPGQAQSPGQPDLHAIDQSWTMELSTPPPAGTILFSPPAETSVADDAFGLMVKRGIAIFTGTPAQAKPYVNNGLTCANCHLDRGRRAGATPMWAA